MLSKQTLSFDNLEAVYRYNKNIDHDLLKKFITRLLAVVNNTAKIPGILEM